MTGLSLLSRSDPYPVVEVNDAVPEAALGQECELDVNVVRQCALSAADNDRAEEQVALIDRARGESASPASWAPPTVMSRAGTPSAV